LARGYEVMGDLHEEIETFRHSGKVVVVSLTLVGEKVALRV